jgi:hypothetical protein
VVNFAAVDPLVPLPSYAVMAGWNLIGYTSVGLATATAIEDNYLRSLGGKWVVIYAYPGWTQGRPDVDPLATGAINIALALGKGYWLYTNADGVLVP